MLMSIDVHDSVVAGRKAAKRVRRRAVESAVKSVEAARDLDLHVPELHVSTDAAKAVARRTAKRAAKQATAAAGRASGRKAKRGSKRLLRVVIFAVVAGGAVGIAVKVVQSKRAASTQSTAVPTETYGAQLPETGHAVTGV